jgi:hypothetical protein
MGADYRAQAQKVAAVMIDPASGIWFADGFMTEAR